MIRFVVHPEATRTWEHFRRWRPRGAPALEVTTYGSLEAADVTLRATYVFADLERLSGAERVRAAALRERLATRKVMHRALNDPLHTLTRRPLLERLHEIGVNEFAVHTIDRSVDEVRLPAFIRNERTHGGPITGLIHDKQDLRRALDKARRMVSSGRVEADELMIVEFVDTATDGIYRKFAAFIVGEWVVPRHVLFSRDWMVKVETVGRRRDLGSRLYAREERRYIETNPHEHWIRSVARDARVDYGRIDYGMRRGRPQIWEINLNPTVCSHPLRYPPRQRHAQRLFLRQMVSALRSIDSETSEGRVLDEP